MPQIPFAVDFDESSAVLTIAGDVDEAESTAIQAAIESHSLGYTRDLSVDLSAVTYLPSVAIGVLAKARQAFPSPAGLELVAAAGTIAQRVLVVCALPHRTT